MRFGWIGIGIGLLFGGLRAEAQRPAPERLKVYPSEVRLESRRAYRQFVVTGVQGGAERDVTAFATYQSKNEKVVRVEGGRAIAVSDGQTSLTIRVGTQTAQVPVTVTNTTRPDPVRFTSETLALLTKQGCASGSCHGSPHGKGGFSLSLFGYDPRLDRISLTRDGFNRRVNLLEPAESLILKKPLLEIPHVGGKRFRKTDTAYRLLHQWLYEGANVDISTTTCDRLVVYPDAGRILRKAQRDQQLSVMAYFSDGSRRDVTAIATYSTSHPSVATVTADGLVTGHNRGQAAISVRYLDKLQAVYFTMVEEVPNFTWKSPPENNWIDRHVNAKLKQLRYLPAPTCSDAEFLRRASLDLTGLLPTPDRTRAFLADKTPTKRTQLVNALLETEEFARFQALKKADLMRVSPRRLTETQAEQFARWIATAIRENRPYDRFARDILTAVGKTEQVSAANYFLAIPSAEERTEMTTQIFMGSRVECAKCHNHPFENWTMRDYYRIAAVFARTQAEKGEVRLAANGEIAHPTTGETMRPWGATKPGEEPTDRRSAFAQWLTQSGNPYFARVEVNRIWADLMGRGIVEPVDDFRASNPPANVPLLDALAQEFERSGYDRKGIIRLICNSQTYQRSSQTNPFNVNEETLFSHAKVRLLTAEQIKDALGMATQALAPPTTLEPRIADFQKQREARTAEIADAFPAWLREQARWGAGAALESGVRSVLTGPPPAPYRAKPGELPLAFVGFLVTPVAQRNASQNQSLQAAYWERDERWRDLKRRQAALENRLEYATQRPFPESSAFTTTFGQPPRETACTCERQQAPTLLQALELLNGQLAHQLAQTGANTYARLEDTRLVEYLYLAALCRFPTERERMTAQTYLKRASDRPKAVMDLVWTVLNTQEFLFQH